MSQLKLTLQFIKLKEMNSMKNGERVKLMCIWCSGVCACSGWAIIGLFLLLLLVKFYVDPRVCTAGKM